MRTWMDFNEIIRGDDASLALAITTSLAVNAGAGSRVSPISPPMVTARPVTAEARADISALYWFQSR